MLSEGVVPRHVAIIMDGNGRWAEKRGKPRVFGHRNGVQSVRSAVQVAVDAGIEVLTLYAFSSENWRRPPKEVSTLMDLFMMVLKREVKRLNNNNVQLRIIGDVSHFSPALQKKIADVQELTAKNTGMVLNVAANYGGRWDIVQACRKLATKVANHEIKAEDIDEQMMAEASCLGGLPDPDLMIRTGGDCRISNFLIWQAAYTELYFSDVLWPDFSEAVFKEALAVFGARERRFGCTSSQVRSGAVPLQTKEVKAC